MTTPADPSTDAPREIELKLECDEAGLAALAAHPLLATAKPRKAARLSSTYHDTADGALRDAGLTLRVRRQGKRRIQTLKASNGAAGLFDRAEWESDIAGDAPDLAALAGTPAAAILADAPGLAPLFATIVERTTRLVAYGGSRVSVTLDDGRIETPAGEAPLREVELELEAGEAADLFAMARALAETVPLRLGALSKSARAQRLVDGTLSRPSKAGAVSLDAEGSAGDAFRAIAQACLRHLRLNEDVFLRSRDPEGLHQIRVALRRLRSAFTLFKAALAHDPAAAHLKAEIKRVTEPFGLARNLDVFLAETLPAEIARRPDEPGLPALREAIEAQRDRAHAAVAAILDSREWRSLILDLAGWIETGPWRAGDAPARDAPAGDCAAAILDKARRRIRKRGRHLEKLDAASRHEVRIEAKKLRYGAEFFGSLFPEKTARKRHKAFVAALSDLQDHLGALNDLATAHEALASLSAEAAAGGQALFAAGLAAADGESRTRALIEAAAEAREDLLDVKPFWR